MKKFDLLSLSGVTVAIVAVLLGQHLEGGSVTTLLNGPAILIVVGGSIGATMLQSPLPVFELCYEELAVDPEPVARRLLDFLGLDWTGSVLEFHRSERGVQTPSRWQVKQPIHTRSIGRWRHYQDQLAPLLARLDPDAYPRPAAAAVASKDQASTPSA